MGCSFLHEILVNFSTRGLHPCLNRGLSRTYGSMPFNPHPRIKTIPFPDSQEQCSSVRYLDAVVRVVEERAAAEGAQHGILGIINQVVCDDGREVVALWCVDRGKIVKSSIMQNEFRRLSTASRGHRMWC